MHSLILGSGSRYRKALLQRLGLPFTTVCPEIDERPLADENGDQLALRLAAGKAGKVLEQYPDAVVIGSDQVATLEAVILGKPGNREAAVAQLSRASGRAMQFHTAVCVADSTDSRMYVDCTTVQFRELGAAEIASYVEREKPIDCAGSFKAEGLGIALFESIDSSDPTALIGLPLIWLSRELMRRGFPVL